LVAVADGDGVAVGGSVAVADGLAVGLRSVGT
jgi:hypothetical protein